MQWQHWKNWEFTFEAEKIAMNNDFLTKAIGLFLWIHEHQIDIIFDKFLPFLAVFTPWYGPNGSKFLRKLLLSLSISHQRIKYVDWVIFEAVPLLQRTTFFKKMNFGRFFGTYDLLPYANATLISWSLQRYCILLSSIPYLRKNIIQ